MGATNAKLAQCAIRIERWMIVPPFTAQEGLLASNARLPCCAVRKNTAPLSSTWRRLLLREPHYRDGTAGAVAGSQRSKASEWSNGFARKNGGRLSHSPLQFAVSSSSQKRLASTSASTLGQ